jgi:anti-anti-sigma factor
MEPIIIRNIFENLPVGLLVIDPQGAIILANSAASTILGYPGEVIAGKGWADLFMGAGENDPFNQVIVDVIWEERLNLHRTVPYVRPNAEVRQLSITTSFIRGDQELVGIVVLLNDVTEIYALHLQEKTILEEKNNLQRERTESLNKLAMAVAHQLRNPTTAIGGFAAIMLKKADPDTMSAMYLQKIVSSTKRLEDVVRSVHDYASLPPVSFRKIALARFFEPLRQRVGQKAAELCRNVSLTISGEAFDVEVDPKLFGEALAEILDNAVEALTSGHGDLEVSVAQEENSLLIAIQDNGAGISDQDLPFIFDPFFTTKAVGVGMGLCRARHIIAEHNGSLWIESIAGIGTKALVRIPRTLSSPTVMKGDQIMEIVDQVIGKATVLKLKGRLDSASAVSLKDKVKDCAKNGQVRLVVDMAEVDFVDSSGLGSLVACLRSVNKLGGEMRIAALQDRVRVVFELIRLHHIFEVFDSVGIATDSLQSLGKDAGS